MTDNYDVVLVGAGHNGLVCATYLAKAGKKVLVLEANATPGGCAATREFSPGYSVSSCAQWLNQLHPAVTRDLALESHGLQWAARELASISLDLDGQHLTQRGDHVEGGNVTAADSAAFREFHAKTTKFAKLLVKAFEARAPKLVESNLTDRLTLIKLGLGLKMLGRDDMSDLMRIILINMYDVMEENFDSAQLKGLLSLDSLLGSHMGPRTPSTVFGYLYRRVGEVFGHTGHAQVKGGMGALGQAMAASAQAAGVDIRLSSAVASIDVDAGRVTGVTLADGQQIAAAIVVSNADPITTFERLVGLRNLETDTARRVSQIRCTGGTAKLHLALNGLPRFTGLDDRQLGQRLVIAPDMNYIERAFNAVKYKEYSTAPALDISIPTVHDAALAPAGGHVLSAIVQFAPYEPEGGWDAHRETFTQLIVDCIASYAPGIKQQIIASELLTPADLERDYGMTRGHWHHGELGMDQVLMMRPFPGATQYNAAFDGLYLCGAGAHPGGGVMGLAGRNAAQEIIKRGAAA
ncbi:MAG: NAD(P)/FAD-dependent oxidoreductase [Halioglobus sp.]